LEGERKEEEGREREKEKMEETGKKISKNK
jgi:hypothetical protein